MIRRTFECPIHIFNPQNVLYTRFQVLPRHEVCPLSKGASGGGGGGLPVGDAVRVRAGEGHDDGFEVLIVHHHPVAVVLVVMHAHHLCAQQVDVSAPQDFHGSHRASTSSFRHDQAWATQACSHDMRWMDRVKRRRQVPACVGASCRPCSSTDCRRGCGSNTPRLPVFIHERTVVRRKIYYTRLPHYAGSLAHRKVSQCMQVRDDNDVGVSTIVCPRMCGQRCVRIWAIWYI